MGRMGYISQGQTFCKYKYTWHSLFKMQRDSLENYSNKLENCYVLYKEFVKYISVPLFISAGFVL